MSHEPAIRRPSMLPLPPLGRARQVAEALSIYIEAAQLGPGDRLPTERELMQALGVGRSSIREAVSHLQALGVLEARIGSGTYILKPVSAHTVHLPLSIEAGGPRGRAAADAGGAPRHRDRGLHRRRPPPHAGGPRADRRGARRDGARPPPRRDLGRAGPGLPPRDLRRQRQPAVRAAAGAAARALRAVLEPPLRPAGLRRAVVPVPPHALRGDPRRRRRRRRRDTPAPSSTSSRRTSRT